MNQLASTSRRASKKYKHVIFRLDFKFLVEEMLEDALFLMSWYANGNVHKGNSTQKLSRFVECAWANY